MKFYSLILTLLLSSAVFAGPNTAGFLSIIPGLGQVYNGNYQEGAGWFLSVALVSLYAPTIGLKLIEYNMYDAYRDAKPGANVSNESFWQNLVAPFDYRNAWDPIGTPIVLLYGGSTWAASGYGPTGSSVLVGTAVGLGEEALFRGFLFPSFSNIFDSKIIGAILSSTLFAVLHPYTPSEQAIIGALGLLWCWQLDRNKYDLRKNIFSHMWVDAMTLPAHWARGGAATARVQFTFLF